MKKPTKPAAKKKKKPKQLAPPPPPPPPKPKRGASRMREQGYRQVILWFDEIELSQIEKAAAAAGKKVATWTRERAYQCAMLELYPKQPERPAEGPVA